MVVDTPEFLKNQGLAAEHNPFEHSFANPNDSNTTNQTDPTKNLPSLVEVLTPNGNHYGVYYPNTPVPEGLLNNSQQLPFDPPFRTGLTPNESSIRSGLSPSGVPPDYSMLPLPLPTPRTQALLGGYTPTTAATIAAFQNSAFPQNHFNPVPHPPRATDPFESQAANSLVYLSGNAAPTQSIAPANMTLPKQRDSKTEFQGNGLMKERSPDREKGSKGNRKRSVDSQGSHVGAGNNSAMKGKKKPKLVEDEDEKRKNFLERNRQGPA
jgi:ATF/CREB family transcription factor